VISGSAYPAKRLRMTAAWAYCRGPSHRWKRRSAISPLRPSAARRRSKSRQPPYFQTAPGCVPRPRWRLSFSTGHYGELQGHLLLRSVNCQGTNYITGAHDPKTVGTNVASRRDAIRSLRGACPRRSAHALPWALARLLPSAVRVRIKSRQRNCALASAIC
jgi:hypothetical protein